METEQTDVPQENKVEQVIESTEAVLDKQMENESEHEAEHEKTPSEISREETNKVLDDALVILDEHLQEKEELHKQAAEELSLVDKPADGSQISLSLIEPTDNNARDADKSTVDEEKIEEVADQDTVEYDVIQPEITQTGDEISEQKDDEHLTEVVDAAVHEQTLPVKQVQETAENVQEKVEPLIESSEKIDLVAEPPFNEITDIEKKTLAADQIPEIENPTTNQGEDGILQETSSETKEEEDQIQTVEEHSIEKAKKVEENVCQEEVHIAAQENIVEKQLNVEEIVVSLEPLVVTAEDPSVQAQTEPVEDEPVPTIVPAVADVNMTTEVEEPDPQPKLQASEDNTQGNLNSAKEITDQAILSEEENVPVREEQGISFVEPSNPVEEPVIQAQVISEREDLVIPFEEEVILPVEELTPVEEPVTVPDEEQVILPVENEAISVVEQSISVAEPIIQEPGKPSLEEQLLIVEEPVVHVEDAVVEQVIPVEDQVQYDEPIADNHELNIQDATVSTQDVQEPVEIMVQEVNNPLEESVISPEVQPEQNLTDLDNVPLEAEQADVIAEETILNSDPVVDPIEVAEAIHEPSEPIEIINQVQETQKTNEEGVSEMILETPINGNHDRLPEEEEEQKTMDQPEETVLEPAHGVQSEFVDQETQPEPLVDLAAAIQEAAEPDTVKQGSEMEPITEVSKPFEQEFEEINVQPEEDLQENKVHPSEEEHQADHVLYTIPEEVETSTPNLDQVSEQLVTEDQVSAVENYLVSVSVAEESDTSSQYGTPPASPKLDPVHIEKAVEDPEQLTEQTSESMICQETIMSKSVDDESVVVIQDDVPSIISEIPETVDHGLENVHEKEIVQDLTDTPETQVAVKEPTESLTVPQGIDSSPEALVAPDLDILVSEAESTRDLATPISLTEVPIQAIDNIVLEHPTELPEVQEQSQVSEVAELVNESLQTESVKPNSIVEEVTVVETVSVPDQPDTIEEQGSKEVSVEEAELSAPEVKAVTEEQVKVQEQTVVSQVVEETQDTAAKGHSRKRSIFAVFSRSKEEPEQAQDDRIFVDPPKKEPAAPEEPKPRRKSFFAAIFDSSKEDAVVEKAPESEIKSDLPVQENDNALNEQETASLKKKSRRVSFLGFLGLGEKADQLLDQEEVTSEKTVEVQAIEQETKDSVAQEKEHQVEEPQEETVKDEETEKPEEKITLSEALVEPEDKIEEPKAQAEVVEQATSVQETTTTVNEKKEKPVKKIRNWFIALFNKKPNESVQAVAINPDQIIKEGYVQRYNSKFFIKRYKLKYLVLTKSTLVIQQHKHDQSGHQIMLSSIQKITWDSRKNLERIVIITQNETVSAAVYDEDERIAWVHALETARQNNVNM